jgi:hypothetical protein
LNWTRLILTVVALVQLAGAGMMDRRVIYDSLRDVEPWQRRQWLAERGMQDYYKATSWKPTTDSGLRCVGRWSYGPSVKVSMRTSADDTIVCLARGSGASIIRFRSEDSLTLDLLSDINCNGIVSRAIIDDTLVYCGMNQGGTGIEVWGVSDLTSPHRLSYVYLPPIMDIAVKDTFLYATGYVQDSLRIFNVADPRNPVQVGACSDSGYPMCVSGDYCYLADQYGLNIVDVSNPVSPHRIGGIGGFEALAVAVRDSLCYVGTYDGSDFTLRVYDVEDPAMPFPIGSFSGIEAHDIYVPPTCDTVLYTPKLHVINIANPANPRQIGFVDCPGWDYGVRVVPALNVALVADYADGLIAVDVSPPQVPAIDTLLFAADAAEDIHVDNDRAYVASRDAGLVVVDASDPAHPFVLGRCDSVGMSAEMMTATACESVAFIGWRWPQRFMSVDVHDPGRPEIAGGVQIFNPPQDMVLRDTFVYVAEQGRLQIINVARPRGLELVGSCILSAIGHNVDLRDSVAYVAMGSSGLVCIDIGNPEVPTAIGSWGGRSSGVSVTDAIAFVAGPYTGLVSLDVSDPTSPQLIDSLYLSDTLWWNDVRVSGSQAYVGGERVLTVDVADPADLAVRGSVTPPYIVERLTYSSPYLYAACLEAGVCVYESTAVGVVDRSSSSLSDAKLLKVEPNPVRGAVSVIGFNDKSRVNVFDAAGRDVSKRVRLAHGAGVVRLGIDRLPRGMYFVCETDGEIRNVVKFVKQ